MKNTITLFCISIIFISSSCTSDGEFTNQLKEKNIQAMIQTYSLDLDTSENQISLFTEAGSKFTFNKTGFTNNESPVSGLINIDIVEIFDKGTMAITGKHTMTESEFLISGGEFHIRAYQEEDELDYMYSYRVDISPELSGDYSADMQIFTGGEELNSSQDWLLAPNNSDVFGVFFPEDSTSYSLFLNNFNWFNCDRFLNDPRPTTSLDVNVPNEFTVENSDVYITIQNEKGNLGLATTGQYPIGLEVHLIFISEIDDQFTYQVISTDVNEDEYKFEREYMESATSEELKNLINGLP